MFSYLTKMVARTNDKYWNKEERLHREKKQKLFMEKEEIKMGLLTEKKPKCVV